MRHRHINSVRAQRCDDLSEPLAIEQRDVAGDEVVESSADRGGDGGRPGADVESLAVRLAVIGFGVADPHSGEPVGDPATPAEGVPQAESRDEAVERVLPDRSDTLHRQGDLVAFRTELDTPVLPEVQSERDTKVLVQFATDRRPDKFAALSASDKDA